MKKHYKAYVSGFDNAKNTYAPDECKSLIRQKTLNDLIISL